MMIRIIFKIMMVLKSHPPKNISELYEKRKKKNNLFLITFVVFKIIEILGGSPSGAHFSYFW